MPCYPGEMSFDLNNTNCAIILFSFQSQSLQANCCQLMPSWKRVSSLYPSKRKRGLHFISIKKTSHHQSTPSSITNSCHPSLFWRRWTNFFLWTFNHHSHHGRRRRYYWLYWLYCCSEQRHSLGMMLPNYQLCNVS